MNLTLLTSSTAGCINSTTQLLTQRASRPESQNVPCSPCMGRLAKCGRLCQQPPPSNVDFVVVFGHFLTAPQFSCTRLNLERPARYVLLPLVDDNPALKEPSQSQFE